MTHEQTEPKDVDRLDESPRYKITTAGIHTIARNGTELDRLVRSSIYHGYTPTIELLRDEQSAKPEPNGTEELMNKHDSTLMLNVTHDIHEGPIEILRVTADGEIKSDGKVITNDDAAIGKCMREVAKMIHLQRDRDGQPAPTPSQ